MKRPTSDAGKKTSGPSSPSRSTRSRVSPANEPGRSRRSFLTRVGTGWAIFTGASTGLLLGSCRFFFPNDHFEPPTRFRIGYPDDYTASAGGTVSEKFKPLGIWVVRNLEGFYVLATICTHLGCTPNWLAAERKFRCPCHGSGFSVAGMHLDGPAPRPLERYKVTLATDGQIEVDKSRTFQQELGQWEDPECFLRYRAT